MRVRMSRKGQGLMFQERSPISPLSSRRALRRLKDPSSEGEGLQDPTERPLQCGRQARAGEGLRCVRVCVHVCLSDHFPRAAAISPRCRFSEAARNWRVPSDQPRMPIQRSGPQLATAQSAQAHAAQRAWSAKSSRASGGRSGSCPCCLWESGCSPDCASRACTTECLPEHWNALPGNHQNLSIPGHSELWERPRADVPRKVRNISLEFNKSTETTERPQQCGRRANAILLRGPREF